MAGNTRLGSIDDNGFKTDQAVTVKISAAGVHVTEQFYVDSSYDLQSKTTIGKMHSTYNVPLLSSTLTQSGPHATVVFEYGPDDYSSSTQPIKDLQVGYESVPLKLVKDAWLNTSEQAEKSDNPDLSISMPLIEYSYTTYDANFSFNESDIESAISLTGTPTGISGATASKWSQVGIQVRKQSGSRIATTQVWQFRPWKES